MLWLLLLSCATVFVQGLSLCFRMLIAFTGCTVLKVPVRVKRKTPVKAHKSAANCLGAVSEKAQRISISVETHHTQFLSFPPAHINVTIISCLICWIVFAISALHHTRQEIKLCSSGRNCCPRAWITDICGEISIFPCNFVQKNVDVHSVTPSYRLGEVSADQLVCAWFLQSHMQRHERHDSFVLAIGDSPKSSLGRDVISTFVSVSFLVFVFSSVYFLCFFLSFSSFLFLCLSFVVYLWPKFRSVHRVPGEALGS